MPHCKAHGWSTAALLFVLVVSGCQQRPILDPVGEATRNSASTSRRVAAVRATPDNEAAGLMPLILSARHPSPVRQAAAERMIQADAKSFWRDAANSIRRIDDWPMLTLIAERSATDGRQDFIPALIQSWARPSIRYTDDDRPERDAIARLAADRDVTDTLWQHFDNAPQDAQARRVTQAAWAILRRTLDAPSLRARLLASPPTHDLHRQLARVAPAVETLPRDREELLRMRTLIASSSDEGWGRRADTLRLNPAAVGGPGVALRHLPAIDHADLSQSGDALRRGLWADLTRRLAGARRVSRGTGDHGQAHIQSTPDTLADHADALGWPDLLVIQMVLDALDDPELVAALFTQAQRDQADTETELGGVLTWDEMGSVIAQPFEPLMRRHDEIYIASDDCITAMHTGLAHYHFHAQRHDNAHWAGPGGGDFTFANNLHANCVVFTFIDRGTLNVDVYFPGEVVIDLGCIQR